MIIPVNNIRFKVAALILAAWGLFGSPAASLADGTFLVGRVIDGDTLVLVDGRRVRLLGIDAPEVGEPWSAEATRSLRKMVMGKKITMTECSRRDPYGRTLGVLRQGVVDINTSLAREGLAVPLLIPPCGAMVADDVLRSAGEALSERKNIYSSPEFLPVPDQEAEGEVGKQAVIAGKINNIHFGNKVVHLNFGDDWKTDFTVVLFTRGQERFASLGIDPEGLLGQRVYVMGKVKRYYGPEVIVNRPEQILPLYDGSPGPHKHEPGLKTNGGAR